MPAPPPESEPAIVRALGMGMVRLGVSQFGNEVWVNRDFMVGRELEQFFPSKHSNPGAEVLRLESIQQIGKLRNIDLNLRKGEIVGLTGLVGAGRTELARVIFGAEQPDSGRMGNPDLPTPPHIVNKLVEAVQKPQNHRYSASKGIFQLRLAICEWYKRRYDVDLDPETEAIVTIGSKEGIAHLSLALLDRGESAFVPNPSYPIHLYSVLIAGGDIHSIPMLPGHDFIDELQRRVKLLWPVPKLLIISFPANPTTQVVELPFFQRIIEFAEEHKMLVVHDLAYADLVFDGYEAPSILEIPGARERAVEFFTLSKSYSMSSSTACRL